MNRFLAFLIGAAALAFVFWALASWSVDRLAGLVPEAAPLLEEARRYSWLVGVVLGGVDRSSVGLLMVGVVSWIFRGRAAARNQA